MEQLSLTLSSLAICDARPQISVRFTVKDPTAIRKEMLRSATVNARRKAEIFCEASGVTLGDLISINYNWGELDIYSHTDFGYCEDRMPMAPKTAIDIDPEDIESNDSATFVWEIR